jgi:hypothetical protein
MARAADPLPFSLGVTPPGSTTTSSDRSAAPVRRLSLEKGPSDMRNGIAARVLSFDRR